MKPLFHVSTEGGPLLIGDVNVVREWRGSDEEDYEDLCREMTELKRSALERGGEHGNALAWDMSWGAGCAYVFRLPDGVLRVVNASLEDEHEEDYSVHHVTTEGEAKRVATIDVPTGILGIIWRVKAS